jgi:hypothetical protein
MVTEGTHDTSNHGSMKKTSKTQNLDIYSTVHLEGSSTREMHSRQKAAGYENDRHILLLTTHLNI